MRCATPSLANLPQPPGFGAREAKAEEVKCLFIASNRDPVAVFTTKHKKAPLNGTKVRDLLSFSNAAITATNLSAGVALTAYRLASSSFHIR